MGQINTKWAKGDGHRSRRNLSNKPWTIVLCTFSQKIRQLFVMLVIHNLELHEKVSCE